MCFHKLRLLVARAFLVGYQARLIVSLCVGSCGAYHMQTIFEWLAAPIERAAEFEGWK